MMTKHNIVRGLIGIALPFALTGAAFAQATTTTPTDGTMATDPAPAPDPAAPAPDPTNTMPAPATTMPAPESVMPSQPSTTAMQQNTALPGMNGVPPMPATKTYPPCTRTLQDSCTNTRREANMRHPRKG